MVCSLFGGLSLSSSFEGTAQEKSITEFVTSRVKQILTFLMVRKEGLEIEKSGKT